MLPTSTFWVAAGDKMITQELTPAIRYLLALSRIVVFKGNAGWKPVPHNHKVSAIGCPARAPQKKMSPLELDPRQLQRLHFPLDHPEHRQFFLEPPVRDAERVAFVVLQRVSEGTPLRD